MRFCRASPQSGDALRVYSRYSYHSSSVLIKPTDKNIRWLCLLTNKYWPLPAPCLWLGQGPAYPKRTGDRCADFEIVCIPQWRSRHRRARRYPLPAYLCTRCIGKVTIPHPLRGSPSGPGPSVAARHLPTLWGVTLYTRGPLGARVGGGVPDAPVAPPVELFWPRRGQSEKGSKALRKMQHSCIF